jgi:hypothetical protein
MHVVVSTHGFSDAVSLADFAAAVFFAAPRETERDFAAGVLLRADEAADLPLAEGDLPFVDARALAAEGVLLRDARGVLATLARAAGDGWRGALRTLAIRVDRRTAEGRRGGGGDMDEAEDRAAELPRRWRTIFIKKKS